MGLPFICPYNVNSIMNPILVMCTGLGYFFNMYRGRPLVREGGVLILTHPTPWEFHPVHHPSYIDFFEQVLSETTDPVEMEARFEKSFAEDEWYRHLYRTSYAYHGVHPFYMWYWGAHALQHLGGTDHVDRRRRRAEGRAPPRLPAGDDARRRPRDGERPRRPRADHHPLPRPADHAGRGLVMALMNVARGLPKRPRLEFPCARADGARRPSSRRRATAARGVDYDTDVGPQLPAPAGPGRVLLDNVLHPTVRGCSPSPSAAASTASPTSSGCAGDAGVAEPLDLRRQPPQPPRLGAHPHVAARAVAPQGLRRRRRRLLLHQPASPRPPPPSRLNAIPIEREGVSRRSVGQAEALLARRLEPRAVPRGRPQPRRLGPAPQAAAPRGWRSGPAPPVVPDPHRRHRPHPPQGRQEAHARAARSSRSAPRCAAAPRARTPATSPPASRRPSPPSPTKPTGDWYAARRRAHAGDTPPLAGPQLASAGAGPGPSATARAARPQAKRRWPDLG